MRGYRKMQLKAKVLYPNNVFYKSALYIANLILLSTQSWAQPAQTVENANKFFAQVITDNHSNAWVFAEQVPAKHTYIIQEQGWLRWNDIVNTTTNTMVGYATKLQIPPFQDSCLWRVTIPAPDFSKQVHELGGATRGKIWKSHYWGGAPTVELEIDWGRVKINRNAKGFYLHDYEGKPVISGGANGPFILISSNHPKYKMDALQFSGNEEMLDRIEYAAKFLQLSCDKTASTGF